MKEGKVYVNDELSLIGLESEPMTPYGNEPVYRFDCAGRLYLCSR